MNDPRARVGMDGTNAADGADGLAAVRQLHALSDLVTPMTLRVFVTLGIPALLIERPMTANEIAERRACDPRVLKRILDHLDARGVVRGKLNGTFELTELGCLTYEDDDASPRSWLVRSLRMRSLAGDINHSVVSLLDVTYTGRTAFEEQYGESIWGRIGRMDIDEARAEFGHRLPVIDPDPIAEALADAGGGTVCDVGAGSGRLTHELLSRGLCVHSHVVDLGPMIKVADELLGEHWPGQYTAVEANFMTDRLPDADVYVVCDVLADWDDDGVLQLLRNIRLSGHPESRVLLTEMIIPAGAGDLFDRTAGSLRLAVEMARPNRTPDELAGFGIEAGMAPVSAESGAHRIAVLLGPAK